MRGEQNIPTHVAKVVVYLDTKLLDFTLPKASRANASELINAKTSYNYGNFGNFNPRAIVKHGHCLYK